jgi:carboxymethylenebutenolidase
VNALAESLRAQGKDAELKVYDGAQHAVVNNEPPESNDADAAADAWARTLQFFRRTLQPAGAGSR